MRKKTKLKTFIFSIIAFIIGIASGLSSYVLAFSPQSDTLFSVASGDLSVHFLELGNKYTGDCIYIKANDNDILIDAGSRQDSATTISNYVNNYCKDGILEYVIATHAHQDHIAAFPSTNTRKGIFELYEVKNIIDFGEATKYERNEVSPTNVYSNYVNYRNLEVEKGAIYTPISSFTEDDFGTEKTQIDLGSGIKLTFLYNIYYQEKTSNENNYSVCLLITQGSTSVLLTGDLEAEGEEELANHNKNKNILPSEVTVFKAAHHGSYTGSTSALLDVVNPKNVVFTCVAGATEYTTNLNNTFPSQTAIESIANYTANCYVTTMCTNSKTDLLNKKYSDFTSMNGDIVLISNKDGYSIKGTNNSTLLKDTTWFSEYRTMPNKWKVAV